jgi:branched-chain amino acid aminotransferase
VADPSFGTVFSDHMVSKTWTRDDGWAPGTVGPYEGITLGPASAALHYAQQIFEGLKAYRHPDGSIWSFRPEANAARFRSSAARLALPELSDDEFIGSLAALVDADRDWVPSAPETSLYLRPFMIGSESFIGVRPAALVDYYVIASPAGPYFSGGVKPLKIWISSRLSRAGAGGTGDAKCGGNYGASLLPQAEALANGCSQVLFLDGVEHRYVEELASMNIFFVYDDGTLVTPELNGNILEGITRDSIIALARERGHDVQERPVTIDEIRDDAARGAIHEIFACGTAAVVVPISELTDGEDPIRAAHADHPETTLALRAALTEIQTGVAPDARGWMTRLG